MQQPQQLNRPRPESFDQWLARHPLLVPLHGMHTRVKATYQISDTAMAQLLHAAKHPNPKVRWFCAHELDHLATAESIDTLLGLAADPVVKVRMEAVHALGCERCKQCKIDLDLVGLLIDFAVNDSAAKVRGAAIHALGYLPADPRAATVLQELSWDPQLAAGLRQAAARSLQYHAPA